MKKLLLLLLVSLLTAPVVVVDAQTTAPAPKAAAQKTVKPVEVYYFHYTRRCATCQAVETETQKAIAALYPAQFKAGKIIFKSLNLDNATSKPFADKCKAEGQSLLIISGNKRIDLTDQAFMYANSKPEKLKAEIKNVIDKMM